MYGPFGSFALNIHDRNSEISFHPSYTYDFLEADKGNFELDTFSWIQAFFDTNVFTGVASLVVWGGQFDQAGNKIFSEVCFAYSGERIPFKGKAIVAAGPNRRGIVVSSTPIGVAPTTDLLKVTAYCGAF